MRKGRLAVLALMALLFIGLVPLSIPAAQATTLISRFPTSGPVGTTVNVFGTIDVLGGEFGIFFDAALVAFGVAAPPDSDVVIANFIVPAADIGFHVVILRDNATGATDVAAFLVTAHRTISIDIKPGSDPNSINCNNEKGVIAVAILTTDDFDATTVDHTTVTFEGASETHVDKKSGDARRHAEDVDGDGDIDLLLHFRFGDTGLTCASTDGTLTGSTFDGTPVEGSDSVRIVN